MFNSTNVTNLAAGQLPLRLPNSQLNLTTCQQQQQRQQQQPQQQLVQNHHHNHNQHHITTSHYATNSSLPFARSLNDRHGLNIQPNHDTTTIINQLQQHQLASASPQSASMSQFNLPNSSQVQHSIGHQLDHPNVASESHGSSTDAHNASGRFIMDQQLYPQLPSDVAFFQQYYHSNQTAANQHHATNLNSSHLYYNHGAGTHHYQQDSQISFANAMANVCNSTESGLVSIRANNTGLPQVAEANQAASSLGVNLNGFRFRQPDNMHCNDSGPNNSDNNKHDDGINLSIDNGNNNHHFSVNSGSNGSSNGVGKINNGSSNNNKRGSRKSSEKNSTSESLKRSFACETCGKLFSEKFNMRRHLQIHNQSRPKYSCNECSRTFAWKDNFIRHRKAAHINNK